MRAVEVTTTTVGNISNSKGEANNDKGTGNEGLDGLMNLKPNGG